MPLIAEIRELPLRATVAFALRCAKRVEPLLHLRPLVADAFSAGVEVGPIRWYGGTAARAAADAFVAAAHAAGIQDAADAADSAAVTARAAVLSIGDDETERVVKADLERFRELNLGVPGELGQPIRWNDPRLGPLWPHGEPKWYTEVVALCRELEEKIRCAPDPNAPPDDPAFLAHMEQWREAERLDNEGKFDAYRGEYVFFAHGQVLGHSRSLVSERLLAEAKAVELGIPPEHVVNYFIPGG
jgi:hypothetical protein